MRLSVEYKSALKYIISEIDRIYDALYRHDVVLHYVLVHWVRIVRCQICLALEHYEQTVRVRRTRCDVFPNSYV